MSSSSSSTITSSKSVFETGNYSTTLQEVKSTATEATCSSKTSTSISPPKPLLIGMPCDDDDAGGEFPVLIFLHGYLFFNSFYSQLILHVASHGFIVIAPQLYNVAGPDATGEITSTAAITNWLTEGLGHFLPPHVRPNLSRLALAGHSRGGKTAFALALKKAATNLKFSALIGVDPVDGMAKGKQTPPPVLTYVPHSFELDMPVMVIGSGLGEIKRNPLFPPCAPKGVNHEEFFNECQPPACHFVVKDYGHVDMLDDDTKGIRGKSTYCLCKNGKSREPMRRTIGGIIVAFMKAYLDGDSSDLNAIRKGHEIAPAEFSTVDFLE